MKTPNFAGFVGHGGDNVWLEPAQQYDDDAQLVLDRPDLFNDVNPPEPEPGPEPVKRGPGRPRKDSVDKVHAVD